MKAFRTFSKIKLIIKKCSGQAAPEVQAREPRHSLRAPDLAEGRALRNDDLRAHIGRNQLLPATRWRRKARNYQTVTTISIKKVQNYYFIWRFNYCSKKSWKTIIIVYFLSDCRTWACRTRRTHPCGATSSSNSTSSFRRPSPPSKRISSATPCHNPTNHLLNYVNPGLLYFSLQ